MAGCKGIMPEIVFQLNYANDRIRYVNVTHGCRISLREAMKISLLWPIYIRFIYKNT